MIYIMWQSWGKRVKSCYYSRTTTVPCRAVPRSKKGGGACSAVVGIICPPGWDRVNRSAKNWGAPPTPPPGPCYDLAYFWHLKSEWYFIETIFNLYLFVTYHNGLGMRLTKLRLTSLLSYLNVVEFPGSGLRRLITINSELNCAI